MGFLTVPLTNVNCRYCFQRGFIILIFHIFLTNGYLFGKPKITWSQETLSHELFVGTTTSVQISFTSNEPLASARVRVVPSLTDFVVFVSPSVFTNIQPGVPQVLTIVLQAPTGSRPSVGGTIRVEGDSPGTLSSPLPLRLQLNRPTLGVIPQSLAFASEDRIVSEPGADDFSFVKDEILIFFKENTSLSTVNQVVSSVNGLIIGAATEFNMYQVQVPVTGWSALNNVVAQVEAASPSVQMAAHHTLVEGDAAPNDVPPNDPGFSSFSSTLNRINLQKAWEIEKGDKAVRVAVIEGSFDYSHPDWSDNIAFQTKNTAPFLSPPQRWHGTRVASIIGAEGNNAIGSPFRFGFFVITKLRNCDI